MTTSTLLFAAVSTLIVAATYFYVGLRLGQHANGNGKRPLVYFALWWIATSVNQMLGAGLYFLAVLGYTDLALQTAYVYLQRLLLAVSLVGLLHYLLTLHTGRGRLTLLLVVYGAYWIAQTYFITMRQPVGVEAYAFRTDLVYAHPAPVLADLFNLLIVLPPVVGALALLRLYKRVEGRTRRFRVGMLAGGFTLWWIVAVAAGQPALYDVVWFQALNRVVGIAVALGILLAYEPMPWMQRRYQLEAAA